MEGRHLCQRSLSRLAFSCSVACSTQRSLFRHECFSHLRLSQSAAITVNPRTRHRPVTVMNSVKIIHMYPNHLSWFQSEVQLEVKLATLSPVISSKDGCHLSLHFAYLSCNCMTAHMVYQCFCYSRPTDTNTPRSCLRLLLTAQNVPRVLLLNLENLCSVCFIARDVQTVTCTVCEGSKHIFHFTGSTRL